MDNELTFAESLDLVYPPVDSVDEDEQPDYNPVIEVERQNRSAIFHEL